MKRIIVLVNLLFAVMFSNAQDKLSGLLYYDSFLSYKAAAANNIDSNNFNIPQHKSPLTSALFSFAVSGAGQFYNEDYWKTAIFVAAEVTAITVGVIYDNKGDDQTSVFENFANGNWDVAKYARWSLTNFSSALLSELEIDVNVKYQYLFTDGTQTEITDWALLNQLENDIGSLSGAGYSHRLAPYGDQQYYEMIGKYKQFNPGWSDFNESGPFNPNDPVTPKFEYYSGLRGKANDYYNIASKAIVIVVVNHFISAIEAAYSAHLNNRKLQMDVSLHKKEVFGLVDYYPQLNFKINF